MTFKPLSSEDCQEAVRLLAENSGNKAKAAYAAGIPITTFKDRLKTAAKRGFVPLDGNVIPGFAISKVSQTLDADGAVKTTSIQQRQEAGAPWVMPEGQAVKGYSVLVNPQGEVIQQWIKLREDGGQTDLVEALKTAFADTAPVSPVEMFPGTGCEDTLTTYNIADFHLGLLAWKPETGTNFDLHIAEAMLKDTITKLVARTPPSKEAVILNLGDFLHSDSNLNRTARSGNVLDVEGRYAKVLQLGVKLLIWVVQLALQKHENVELENIPGNHDPQTSLTLSIALDAYFHGNPRVKINTSPSSFWHREFGKVLLTATHGDMIKPEAMPGVIAAYFPEAWGRTEFRYCYLGHVHHSAKGGGELHGLTYEVFRTIAAKDNWAYQSGYSSARSMVAITHNSVTGEDTRTTVSIPKFVQEKF